MALQKCTECGREVSSTAAACNPLWGKTVPRGSSLWTGIKVGVAAIFGLLVYQCVSITQVADPLNSPAALAKVTVPTAAPTCSPQHFSLSGLKFRRERDFIYLTGTITNNGSQACGVQLKTSSYDSKNTVVDTSDYWPASIRNIEPGAKENFSHMVRYDGVAKTYDVVAIGVGVDPLSWTPDPYG